MKLPASSRSAASVIPTLVLILLLAQACSAGNPSVESQPTEPAEMLPDPGVVHVHGLGVNPRDGALFAATHTGLFRIVAGKAERVGDRHQDTMGFTIVGQDHFIGSGHPDIRDYTAGKLPGLWA